MYTQFWQIAEAFCNQLVKGKVKVGSAGTLPAESVEPMVVEVTREVGIDVSNQRPNLLTQDMIDHTGKLIVMGSTSEKLARSISRR